MIYPRGKQRIYWMRFRFAGRFVHESTRTTSKTLARDAERQRRRELEETYNGVQKRTLPPTITQASKSWIDKRAGLAAGTRATYEAALVHVRAKLGTLLVCEVTAKDIFEYQQKRVAEGSAAATVNKEVCCISSVLGGYGAWERIRRDVKRLAENENAGQALDPAMERLLFERAASVGQHQGNWTPIYIVSVLGMNTGMRSKEIRTLRWRNIDLETGILRVAESKTPSGIGRAIPLSSPPLAALQYWAGRFPERQPEHFAFPACENGRIDPKRPIRNWRTAWRRATRFIDCPVCELSQNPGKKCQNAGCGANIFGINNPLKGLRFHDLRHCAATKLLEQGTAFAVVAVILGWSASTAIRMAKRYGHIRPDVQREALRGIATGEISLDVNQFVHQPSRALESKLPN